jgi:hypothetical protein
LTNLTETIQTSIMITEPMSSGRRSGFYVPKSTVQRLRRCSRPAGDVYYAILWRAPRCSSSDRTTSTCQVVAWVGEELGVRLGVTRAARAIRELVGAGLLTARWERRGGREELIFVEVAR